MYYINGKFLLNENIDAMKVEEGKISWMGKTDELSGEETVDLKGSTVLPALVESHIHPIFLADLEGKLTIMPPAVNSIEEMIEKLIELDKKENGKTIEGWGYDESFFLEGRSPNRYDLDKVSTTKPVKVQRSDLHNVVVNSYALEKMGITKDTPDPKGGFIRKDEKGEPTGLLSEQAAFLIKDLFESGTLDEKIHKMVRGSKTLAEYGIGSMTETLGVLDDKEDTFDIYVKAMEQGYLQDISLYYYWSEGVQNLSEEELSYRIKGVGKDAKVFLKGIKYFLDGTISSGTAGMTREYPSIEDSLYVTRDHKKPTSEDLSREKTKGLMTGTKEELAEIMAFCKEKGLQVKIHAMGDYSVDLILELAEDFGSWIENGPSIRIEHGSTLRDDQIEKIHHHKISVSGQSIFFFAEYEPYTKFIDEELFLQINRLRSLYKPGELNYPYVALSNDAPSTYHPTPANPWLGIEGTVTRRSLKEKADINQKEKLELKDALKLYTINAANINLMKDVGELKVGKQANFIIIDQDLEKLPEDQLHDIIPEEVYIRGEKIEFK